MASWRANATRRPKAILQENFFRTQVGYLKGGLAKFAGGRRYKSCRSARRRWPTTGPTPRHASSAIRMRGCRRRTRGRSIATRGCEKSRRSRTRTGAGSMKRRSSRTTSSGESCAAAEMHRPRMHRRRLRVDGLELPADQHRCAAARACPDAAATNHLDGSVTSRLGRSSVRT